MNFAQVGSLSQSRSKSFDTITAMLSEKKPPRYQFLGPPSAWASILRLVKQSEAGELR
jgi:hypothetical protein